MAIYPKNVSSSDLTTQFQRLKLNGFTGQLLLRGKHFLEWTFYLDCGNWLWLTGGPNDLERWHRNLELFGPNRGIQGEQLINSSSSARDILSQLLSIGASDRLILKQLIESVLSEGLFDIIQYLDTQNIGLDCQTLPFESKAGINLPALDINCVIQIAQTTWMAWKDAGLATCSPNFYPAICEPEILVELADPGLYHFIRSEVDGTRSLRLLAKKSAVDVLSLTKSLLPLGESGALSFQKSPSLKRFPLPEFQPLAGIQKFISSSDSVFSELPTRTNSSSELIACIDDSELCRQVLKNILIPEGYRFLGILEPLRAPAILLKSKPDLIFLDVMMPLFNGYELCAQLRKVSFLKKVPIVFLTSKDGLVDRARAKMVGANGFLSKPIRKELVQGVVKKYLPQQRAFGS